MTFVQRIHCWMADHFAFVQYPHIRATGRVEKLSFFKHRMPLSLRVGLFFYGVTVLSFCAIALFLFAFCAWSLLRHLFR